MSSLSTSAAAAAEAAVVMEEEEAAEKVEVPSSAQEAGALEALGTTVTATSRPPVAAMASGRWASPPGCCRRSS